MDTFLLYPVRRRFYMAETKGKFPNGLAEAMSKKGIGSTPLAKLIGDSKQNVTRWANQSRRLMPEIARKIAPHLDVTADQLLLLEQQPRIIRPAGPEKSDVEFVSEGYPDAGDEWMDLRGVVEGGPDGGFEFGNVIDQVRRPPGLKKAKHAAALNVAGESMVPRFMPGELIYVHQRLAVPGDDVVVELHPETDGDTPKAFLKQFVRKTGLRIYCKQHNPASEIEFDAGEVRTLWRVVPLRELLF